MKDVEVLATATAATGKVVLGNAREPQRTPTDTETVVQKEEEKEE